MAKVPDPAARVPTDSNQPQAAVSAAPQGPINLTAPDMVNIVNQFEKQHNDLLVVHKAQVKLTDAVTDIGQKLSAMSLQLKQTSELLETVPGLMDVKCSAVREQITSQHDEKLATQLEELATQVSEQLNTNQNTALAVSAAVAPPAATFAAESGPSRLTFADSVSKVKGNSPAAFPPQHTAPRVGPADQNQIDNCAFSLRWGSTGVQCLEKYGAEAVLANSDSIPMQERNSQKFLALLETMSGKQSTLPAVDLRTPTRSDLQNGSLNLRTSPTPSIPEHDSDLSAARSGRPMFKVNLAQPPRFTKITVESDVVSWLHKVAKVCRLAGYPEDNWTLFASTLLECTPQTLFDAAEREAMKTGAAAHASFLDWHNLIVT